MDKPALLDFFTLEASACVERLDGLVAAAGNAPPSADAMLADARTLRGSATMARQMPIAEVAAGLERVARGIGDRTLTWNAGVNGVVVAAIDDLKILIRAVRAWDTSSDARARARRDELERIAPMRTRRSGEAFSSATSSSFIAGELDRIAVALGTGAERSDRAALLDALPRIRALRGMASLRDMPPVGDALSSAEDCLLPLERGAASLDANAPSLLRTVATFLRRAASDVRAGETPDSSGAEARAFADARDASVPPVPSAAPIVPVTTLFHDDAGPHVVSSATNPPTTSSQRFRMEVVSQAEHLRRLVSDARSAVDPASQTRANRGLAHAVASLQETAESFGERGVASFFAAHHDIRTTQSPDSLRALAEAAELLSDPRGDTRRLNERLSTLVSGRAVDDAIGAGLATMANPTPAAIPVTEPRLSEVLAVPAPSPRGSGLRALLESGLAGFSSMTRKPMATPANLDEDLPAIDQFVYRGRAALDRARKLRDDWQGRGAPPAQDELAELYDLLDLATAE